MDSFGKSKKPDVNEKQGIYTIPDDDFHPPMPVEIEDVYRYPNTIIIPQDDLYPPMPVEIEDEYRYPSL